MWCPSHCGIKGSDIVDVAARNPTTGTTPSKLCTPEDFKPFVASIMQSEWQSLWDNIPNTNKLKNIRPSIKAWKTSDQDKRFQEVILTWMRKITLLSVSVATSSPSATCCLAASTIKSAPPSNLLHLWMTAPKASTPSLSTPNASTSTI
ncbi:hypothetical protein M8J77_011792 [Diaphorina citri]|nr:hypothetical protein M8J77_011792 [Diaphorina citri]